MLLLHANYLTVCCYWLVLANSANNNHGCFSYLLPALKWKEAWMPSYSQFRLLISEVIEMHH